MFAAKFVLFQTVTFGLLVGVSSLQFLPSDATGSNRNRHDGQAIEPSAPKLPGYTTEGRMLRRRPVKNQRRLALTVNGTLTDSVPSSNFDLSAYDSSNEDGTIKLFKVTSSSIEFGKTVRCTFSCVTTSKLYTQGILFHEGSPPTSFDDHDDDRWHWCGLHNDYIMESTADLYVFVATTAQEGVSNAQVTCRVLPDALVVDSTLSSGIPSSTFNLASYKPLDEEGTVKVFELSSAEIAAGTEVSCTLSCTTTSTLYSQTMRFHEIAPPTIYDDFDKGQSGPCGFTSEYVMESDADLYVFVVTDAADGVSRRLPLRS